MGLVVNGIKYDATAQPFIGDLRLLKKTFGFGWGTVARRLKSLDDDIDPLDLMDDDDFVDALMAWMWMSRLRAGERDCTIEDVRQTPIDSIQLEDDEPTAAEQAAADPTSAPTDTDRGDDELPAVVDLPTRASTKTSRKRSTAG